jgi:hypothetical protein
MRSWEGIRRDTAATGEGAQMAVNTRFYLEGELQRRLARQLVLINSSGLGIAPYGPPRGEQYVALATTAGWIQVIKV